MSRPKGKIEVVNVKTGKSVMVEPVDAREYVATGGWKYRHGNDLKAVAGPIKVTLIHKKLRVKVDVDPGQVLALIETGEYVRDGEESQIEQAELGTDTDQTILVAAIKSLPPEKDMPDAWTKGGKPSTDYLGKLLNRPVSGAERDHAWETVTSA